MPEEILSGPQPERESSQIESDIDRLAAEVSKHRESPEASGSSEHEVVKQAIKSMTVPSPQSPSKTSSDKDDSVLPEYMHDAAPAAKLEVEDLVRVAFTDGVAKANNVARKSSPFVLDAFHDALAGKLHAELKKRKMI